MGPVVLFAVLLAFEVAYWGFFVTPRLGLERRLRRLSPLTFYLVPVPYLIRLAILAAYVAVTGAPVFAGLVANLPAGLGVGVVLALAQLLVLVRGRPVWPAGQRDRLEVALFFGYTLLVIGIVEELLFRGALLLAVGDGWQALLGSSVAMAAWHLPYYVTTLGVTRLDQLARSMTLVTLVSLVFGTAAIATASLWASIVPHALGDFVGHLPRFGPGRSVAPSD